MERKILFAHIALFLVGVIYGLNYIIAKDVMVQGYLQPFFFILMRVTAAVILFWIIGLFFIRERVKREHILYLALCAVFGVAANQLFFFSGLKLSSPINASLIMTCNPVLVLLLAHLILHERMTMRKTIGIAISMVGAIWLILSNNIQTGLSISFWGDVMVFLNATSYGIYLILIKKVIKHYHPLTIVKWVFTFGWLYVLPFGLYQMGDSKFSEFTTNTWLSVGYVLIFTTFFAYLLNAVALKTVSPTVVSVYIYLQPIIATAAAIILARDHLTNARVWSGILIFIGIYLVSWKGRKWLKSPNIQSK